MPGGPVRAGGAFLDPLVARLSARYGIDPREVRSRAVEAFASFAGARVQAFVPLLVENRLRETFGRRSGPETIPAVERESEAIIGMTAGSGRRMC